MTICAGPDCTRSALLRGLCRAHYNQQKTGRSLAPLGAARAQKGALGLHNDGTADVLCWCEQVIVRVPTTEIRAGLTRACRWDGCRERDERERAKATVV